MTVHDLPVCLVRWVLPALCLVIQTARVEMLSSTAHRRTMVVLRLVPETAQSMLLRLVLETAQPVLLRLVLTTAQLLFRRLVSWTALLRRALCMVTLTALL